MRDTRLIHVVNSNLLTDQKCSYVSYVSYADTCRLELFHKTSLVFLRPQKQSYTQLLTKHWSKLLTLKTGVPKCLPTETFVILHSVDDYWPSKYVCKNENVGLFQAGSRL